MKGLNRDAAPEPADPPATEAGRCGVRLGELEGRIGFHLRLAHTRVWRDFSASLAGLDLTQKHAGVLEIVGANPGVSQIDIAAALGSDRATVMTIVDRLQARGLLERRPSARDRRRQELHLTRSGGEALAQVHALIDEHEGRFTSLFTEAELEALMSALRRIHSRG